MRNFQEEKYLELLWFCIVFYLHRVGKGFDQTHSLFIKKKMKINDLT